MKIKINKDSRGGSWYGNRLGHILDVVHFTKCTCSSQGMPGDVYWCRESRPNYSPLNWVLASDASIVEESHKITPCPLPPLIREEPEITPEPEELVSQGLYLLQLIQQDLNISHKERFIWARAKKAREALEQLESIYTPQ